MKRKEKKKMKRKEKKKVKKKMKRKKKAAAKLLKEIRVGPNLALRHGREILLRFQPLCRGKQYSLH